MSATLASITKTSATKGALVFAACAVSLLAASTHNNLPIVPETGEPAYAVIIRANNCWTGAAPIENGQSVFPHHAVVTLPGQQTRLVDSSVGFAVWENERPGTLHAFCH